jgi:uncharacterized membrane protein YidH (DUF202 family)
MKILAVLLVAVGLVGLIYGGVTWTRQEKVLDIGPVEVTRNHEKSVPVPPIVGGVCLVAGVVLLLKGRTAVA